MALGDIVYDKDTLQCKKCSEKNDITMWVETMTNGDHYERGTL